jgi:mono/diheme cytochrome c family protein
MSRYSTRTRRHGDAGTRGGKAISASHLFSFRRVSASPRLRVFLLTLGLLFSVACRQDMQDQPRYEAYESSAFFKDGLSSRPLVEGTVPRGYLRADKQLFTGQNDKTQNSSNTNASVQRGEQAVGANSNAQGSISSSSNSGSANMRGGNNAGTQTSSTSQTGAQAAAGDDNDTEDFPFPVTAQVMERGQERYQIFCAMCHGATGDGDGMVVRRGFRQPPSYHQDSLRQARVGHFFRVITEGYGAMPSYRSQVPVQDRWAIIAYIRALQLSRMNLSAPAATSTANTETGGHR